jgi:hypothetical protein
MTPQTQANSLQAPPPAIVVFGRDDAGKPHASSFVANEVALAQKAARLMGMKVMPVDTEAQQALAAKVPRGRVFASGRAFTPFIKGPLFDALVAACPADEPAPEPATSSQSPDAAAELTSSTDQAGEREPAALQNDGAEAPRQPHHWGDIKVGAIVLASTAPRHLDWHECLVIAVASDRVTLRYCDWPHEPIFKRKRTELALMHPSRQPEPPLDPGAAPAVD